jgi:DNA-binding XRE family transcriptional regulator
MQAKPKILAQRIKRFRRQLGLTQDNLARKADIPYTTLIKIEAGVIKNPSLDTAVKIAKGLDITLEKLIA